MIEDTVPDPGVSCIDQCGVMYLDRKGQAGIPRLSLHGTPHPHSAAELALINILAGG